jgi:Flp pilus assembly pilin Flp
VPAYAEALIFLDQALVREKIMAKRRVLPFCALVLAVVRDRYAVTALEYAIIAAIIVATVVIGFTSLSGVVSSQFNTIGAGL